MTQTGTETRLTPAEKRLIEALLDPGNRFKSISEICDTAKCGRRTYYRAFDRPRFREEYKRQAAALSERHLGQVMNEVALRGDEYIVERAGKPLVAIISMDRYRMLERDRISAMKALNDIWEKMKGENPQVIEDAIDDAVKAVRDKRT